MLKFQPKAEDNRLFIHNEFPPYTPTFISFGLTNGDYESIAYTTILRIHFREKENQIIINTTKECITITGKNLSPIYESIAMRMLLLMGVGTEGEIVIESIELKNKIT